MIIKEITNHLKTGQLYKYLTYYNKNEFIKQLSITEKIHWNKLKRDVNTQKGAHYLKNILNNKQIKQKRNTQIIGTHKWVI